MLGFLRTLRQSTRRKQIPKEEGRQLYENLSRTFLYHLNLKTATATKAPEPPKTTTWRMPGSTIQDTKSPTNHVTPEAMIQFLSSLFEDDFRSHQQIFPERIRLEARFMQGEQITSLWIPVFQDLTTLLEKHRISLTTPLWRDAYQSLLRQYLLIFVGREPQKQNVAIRQVSCPCKDCSALNRFLASPSEQVGRFPMSKKRRQHLHNQLDRHYIDCTHETERWSYPETLVVTKLTKHLEDVTLKWSKRRIQAEAQLWAFDQAKLRVLLSDQYEEIMEMRFLLANQPDPPSPTELAMASAYTSTSTSMPPRHYLIGGSSSTGTFTAPIRSSPMLADFRPSTRIGSSMPDPYPNIRRTGLSAYNSHDRHPPKRRRILTEPPTPPPPRAIPTNPTLEQLAQLDAEIARSAGAPPPPPLQTTTATPKSHSTFGAAVAAAAARTLAGSSHTPFRPVNDGRSTWRGGGMGSSPTTSATRRPTTTPTTTRTTTAVIGNKRKIVDVIDLTEDD